MRNQKRRQQLGDEFVSRLQSLRSDRPLLCYDDENVRRASTQFVELASLHEIGHELTKFDLDSVFLVVANTWFGEVSSIR